MTAVGLALVATGIVGIVTGGVPVGVSLGATLLGVLVLLGARRTGSAAMEADGEEVVVDQCGVRRRTADGREECVTWADLVRVAIVTTEDGPLSDDLFFLLQADDGTGCIIANAQAAQTGLVARLQRLPGFDNEALLQASACTVDAHFVCWRGAPGDGLVAAQPCRDEPQGEPN